MGYTNTKSMLGLIVLTLTLSACSSNKDEVRPQWIDQPQSKYPSNLYLSAVGQGSTHDRAANRALSNLSKIFSVGIEENTQDLTQAISQRTVSDSNSQTTESITREISTRTDQELQGAIVKEGWQAPMADYYSIAVLEKQPAARRLTQTVRNADQATQNLLDYSANKAPNPILALDALRQARIEQIKREAANQQLSQVATKGIKAKITSKGVEDLIRQSLATLKISTQAESDSSNQTLQAALGQLGIPYVKNSNLRLEAKLDTIEPMHKENWYWLRGSYELSFFDGDTVISRKRWSIKISAKEEALLAPRLQDEINSKLPSYLIELLSTTPTV